MISALDIPFLDLADKLRNIDVDRTSFHTFRFLAVKAAGCFLQCFIFVISEADFLEIRGTDLRILLTYRYSFLNSSHYLSPPQTPHPP